MRFSVSRPLASTAYGDSAVTAIRYPAFSDGRSLQGNHDGAPSGWPATMTPSESSSQPTSPHRPRSGRGAPV